MNYAYDLDGTLVDSYAAVLASYRAVDVEPPPDFFGKPWRAWLPTLCESEANAEELHRRKNVVYLKAFLRQVRPLPLAEMFKRTGGIIITGASASAAYGIVGHLFPDMNPAIMHSLTMEDKASILNRIPDPGVVFDDSLETIDLLRSKTKWTAFHVQYSSPQRVAANVMQRS